MFGGYTDVAAYYMDAGDLSINTNGYDGSLPQEFTPVLPAVNPWNAGTRFREDFMKFSEQEGPKPLITIPKDSGGSFDLNAFAVRILSVDHHAVGGVHCYNSEDTSVVLMEKKAGVYAYVHHFTLHDSQARGFVRPFCMAFVTSDEHKIMKFYEDISSKFELASKCFKHGNHELFRCDMDRYIQDLNYTRERFIQRDELIKKEKFEEQITDDEEEKILRGSSLSTINSFINEIKEIISKVNQNSMNKYSGAKFQGSESSSLDSKNAAESVAGGTVCVENGSVGLSVGTPLDSLSDTDSGGATSLQSRISSSLSTARLSSSYTSRTEKQLQYFLEKDTNYQPKVVRTLNRKRFDKTLRNLHELCLLGAKQGLNRLRNIQKQFKRDLAELLIEKRESYIIEPRSALLTIGGSIAVNFMSSNHLVPVNDGQVFGTSGLKALQNRHLLKGWISDDTASVHSAESYVSCCDDDHAFLAAASASRAEQTDSLSSSLNLAFTSPVHSVPVSMSAEDPNDSSVYQGLTPHELSSDFYGTPGEGSQYTLSGEDTEHESMNEDDVFSSNQSGCGIMQFLQTYAFSPHLLYSLLTGTTVVVLGNAKMQKDVEAIIRALSLFVPAHARHSHAIVWWRRETIKLTDLARAKLIGLCREKRRSADHMVPSSVRRYVSVLDLEQRTLWAPPYQGGIITSLISKRKHLRHESTYISFIHSVLLELANKAFVYYHSFCVNSPSVHKATLSDCYQACQEISKAALDFLANLGINQQDAKIVQFFTEIIKVEQAQQHHSNKGFSTSDVVKLNTKAHVLFKV